MAKFQSIGFFFSVGTGVGYDQCARKVVPDSLELMDFVCHLKFVKFLGKSLRKFKLEMKYFGAS